MSPADVIVLSYTKGTWKLALARQAAVIGMAGGSTKKNGGKNDSIQHRFIAKYGSRRNASFG